VQPQPLLTDVTIRIVEGGFPHSEISGSKLVRSSPELIAAYHVLHRLSSPRHPPNALKALDRSHDRCSHSQRNSATDRKDQLLAEYTRYNSASTEAGRHGIRDFRMYSLFTMTKSGRIKTDLNLFKMRNTTIFRTVWELGNQ
jgi:hypothetical protein